MRHRKEGTSSVLFLQPIKYYYFFSMFFPCCCGGGCCPSSPSLPCTDNKYLYCINNILSWARKVFGLHFCWFFKIHQRRWAAAFWAHFIIPDLRVTWTKVITMRLCTCICIWIVIYCKCFRLWGQNRCRCRVMQNG